MKFGQKSVISSTAEAPFVAVQDFKPSLEILISHFYFFIRLSRWRIKLRIVRSRKIDFVESFVNYIKTSAIENKNFRKKICALPNFYMAN